MRTVRALRFCWEKAGQQRGTQGVNRSRDSSEETRKFLD